MKRIDINMYFMQISDTHHLNTYQNNTDCFSNAFSNIHNIIGKLEMLQKQLNLTGKKLDFICHCGDITHGGELEDYQKIHNTLTTLFPDTPILVTVGNHDDKTLLQQAFFNETNYFFAKCYNINNLQILSIDNATNQEITKKTCEWILECLNKNQNKDCILMCHYHLLENQCAMPPAKIHPLFENVLQSKNLKCILTGHSHYHYVSNISNIPYYTVGSMSFKAVETSKNILDVYEASEYNIFSYDEGNVKLEIVGDLGYNQFLGIAKL